MSPSELLSCLRMDMTKLIRKLSSSVLCGDPGSFPDDVDEMADLYNSTLVEVVNSLLPNITSHPYRYKEPWFDVGCRREKRHLTRLRRVTTGQQLKTATRSYLRFLRSKRRACYAERICEVRHPERRWKLIKEASGLG